MLEVRYLLVSCSMILGTCFQFNKLYASFHEGLFAVCTVCYLRMCSNMFLFVFSPPFSFHFFGVNGGRGS